MCKLVSVKQIYICFRELDFSFFYNFHIKQTMANVMFLIDFLYNENIHPLREVVSVCWHKSKKFLCK